MSDWVAVGSVEELEAIVGPPSVRATEKVHRELGDLHRRWLGHSPFCLVATAAADGSCDISPKGDQPGFVLVIDERTIALPDRQGSRRVDGFHNLMSNPHVGLIFLIPGRVDALRINGRARVLRQAPFFSQMELDGVRPQLALLVDIDEVFLHSTRAFVRSGIWEHSSFDQSDLPSEEELARALEG
jgi:uncharacterized protein